MEQEVRTYGMQKDRRKQRHGPRPLWRRKEALLRNEMRRLPKPSSWRKQSIVALLTSAMLFLPGCASKVIVDQPQTIPPSLLEKELPIWKAWSSDFLSLLRDVTEGGQSAPKSTTR